MAATLRRLRMQSTHVRIIPSDRIAPSLARLSPGGCRDSGCERVRSTGAAASLLGVAGPPYVASRDARASSSSHCALRALVASARDAISASGG